MNNPEKISQIDTNWFFKKIFSKTCIKALAYENWNTMDLDNIDTTHLAFIWLPHKSQKNNLKFKWFCWDLIKLTSILGSNCSKIILKDQDVNECLNFLKENILSKNKAYVIILQDILNKKYCIIEIDYERDNFAELTNRISNDVWERLTSYQL